MHACTCIHVYMCNSLRVMGAFVADSGTSYEGSWSLRTPTVSGSGSFRKCICVDVYKHKHESVEQRLLWLNCRGFWFSFFITYLHCKK